MNVLPQFSLDEATRTLSVRDPVADADVPIANLSSVIIDARMFLRGDGNAEDPAAVRAFTAAIATACAAGRRPCVQASGVFHLVVDPQGPANYGERYCINFTGCTNAYFNCAAATWLIDGQDNHALYANGLMIPGAVGLSGDLGNVDWYKLPFAQGVVLSKTASAVTITLDAGFAPAWNEAQRLEKYDRLTRENLNNILTRNFPNPVGGDVSGYPVTYGAGTMTIDLSGDAGGLAFLATMAVGDVYVVTYRIYGGDAVRVTGCVGTELKVKVAAAAGMAVRMLDCTDTKIVGRVHPTGARLISTTADGIHVRSMRGYLDVDAEISGTGDDALNAETDSYDVSAVSTPRTVTLVPSYPYLLPRVGDTLIAISAAGAATAMGNVASVDANSGAVTMDTDLAAGFATTWQVTNPSATPQQTFVDVWTGPCRGNVLLQIPGVVGTIEANGLHGCVQTAYIPSFTSEGVVPSYLNLKAIARRCSRLLSSPGAVVIQSTLPGSSVYAPAGTILNGVVEVYVDDTRNSALFVSSATNMAIKLIASRSAGQNAGLAAPDTANFAGAGSQLALVNCERPLILSAANQGAVAGTTYKSNVADLVAVGLANFTS